MTEDWDTAMLVAGQQLHLELYTRGIVSMSPDELTASDINIFCDIVAGVMYEYDSVEQDF